MKKFLQEFKEFALKGNVMDMAVGVIIGAAFGNIVTALTEDFINPPLSLVSAVLKLQERSSSATQVSTSTGVTS